MITDKGGFTSLGKRVSLENSWGFEHFLLRVPSNCEPVHQEVFSFFKYFSLEIGITAFLSLFLLMVSPLFPKDNFSSNRTCLIEVRYRLKHVFVELNARHILSRWLQKEVIY